MNKQKIKGIVRCSIKQNIQNKWFVVFNILLLILLVIMANANNIRKFLEDNNIKLFNDEITIEYVDTDNLIGDIVEKTFEEYEKVTVSKIDKNEYTQGNIKDNLVVLEIFKDDSQIIKAKITSKEGIDGGVYEKLISILEEIRIDQFSKNNNIERDKLELLNSEVSVERVMLGVDAENSDTKQAIQFASTFIVYMISIFIFSKIANEIANEKVSKSIEYVLTTVTAKEYLLAKIISVIAVVLIQSVFVLVYYMIGNLLNSLIMISSGVELVSDAEVISSAIDKDIIAYICVVFVYSLLTLILLSIIQAALSSKTTNMSEAGNSMTFLMVITVAVYMCTFSLINPYTNMNVAIYIISCIPLVSNYFIPAIMIIGQAKTWQIIVSFLLLVISIPVAFNICSKVFKNGVLDYNNKKSKNKKVKKELTLKEEQELKFEKYKFRTIALAVGMSIIIYFVLQVVCQVILDKLFPALLLGILTESQISLIVMALTSVISLVLPYAFLNLYCKKANFKNDNKKYNRKFLLIAIFFTAMIQIILMILQTCTGLENKAVETILDIEGLDNLFTQILFVLSIAIIPGIFEELLFRKGLINLTKDFGDKFAILFSSLVFAFCHLNVTQGVFAFLMGLVLGTLYVKTGNMKYNMLLHALNNAYAAICTILITCEGYTAVLAFNIIVMSVILLGGLVFIKELFRKVSVKEKLITIEGKAFPENIKYMLTDYTFIIGIILLALAFGVTESMLKLL
ncbi:MAG: ABC transporter permease [Clostridia bacterium]|nr:ABC transporter permease [Clostridia bacterium]